MRTVGVVAEYNPFHFGHRWQTEELRRRLGDVGIIAVMSGDFVQRGDAAVFDRHARAAAAVSCGVDLVLELPVAASLSTAERFTREGVRILAACGVDHLAFGSECGDVERLAAIADALAAPEAEARLRSGLRLGLSYAAARQRAAASLLGDVPELSSPNDILGVGYLSAIRELGASLRPVAIARRGVHDGEAGSGFESASLLRTALLAGESLNGRAPEAALAVYRREAAAGRGPVGRSALESAILARLRTMTDGDFSRLPDATDELRDRFRRAARAEPDVESVLAAAKTRRYTASRCRRLLFCAYLGLTEEDAARSAACVRVLAFNARGRALLREMAPTLPLVTRPAAARRLSEDAARQLKLEARAGDLYALAFPTAERRGGREWRLGPINIQDGED